MLDQEVIGRPWSSPLVLVWKKDRDMSLCVNYRRLNAITKSDAFPLRSSGMMTVLTYLPKTDSSQHLT